MGSPCLILYGETNFPKSTSTPVAEYTSKFELSHFKQWQYSPSKKTLCAKKFTSPRFVEEDVYSP